jgi:two-component system chemotaxis response regulator CheB
MTADAAVSTDADQRPWLVVLAASAGGIAALNAVLGALPRDFNPAVIVIQHRSPDAASILDSILARSCRLPVANAAHGQAVEPGTVFVARPDLHLTIDADRRFRYIDGTRIKHVRSSANPLLETAAAAFGGRVIAVVLTGHGSDATDGVQSVRAAGGIVIAQDPRSAESPGMPLAAIRSHAVDAVLPLEDIAPALAAIVSRSRSGGPDAGRNALSNYRSALERRRSPAH